MQVMLQQLMQGRSKRPSLYEDQQLNSLNLTQLGSKEWGLGVPIELPKVDKG